MRNDEAGSSELPVGGARACSTCRAPACKPGGVLVRSSYSLISTGTEMMKVSEARLSLMGKAKARPDQVRKLLDSVAQQGPLATYQKAMNRLDSYTPLGYSLCGVVVEVGAGAEEFAVGDVVAAAGNEFALHAELNWVPDQPVRAGADGCRVRARRVRHRRCDRHAGRTSGRGPARARPRASSGSASSASSSSGCSSPPASGSSASTPCPSRVPARREGGCSRLRGTRRRRRRSRSSAAVDTATGRTGCDHVFLAAGGRSNGPVELAVRLARDRARVVDIGKTRLDLPWNAYYEKELDVRFSRSYGPGRYDDSYELDGVDYPAGYVRWTERRNLQCFLDLIAGDQLEVGSLVSGTFPIDEAVDGVLPAARTGRSRASASCWSTRLRVPTGRSRPRRRGTRPLPVLGWLSAVHRAAAARCGSASSAQATTPPRCCCRTWPRHPKRTTGGGRYHDIPVGGERPAASSASSVPRPTRRRCSTTTRIDAVFVVTRHQLARGLRLPGARRPGRRCSWRSRSRSPRSSSTGSWKPSRRPATTG